MKPLFLICLLITAICTNGCKKCMICSNACMLCGHDTVCSSVSLTLQDLNEIYYNMAQGGITCTSIHPSINDQMCASSADLNNFQKQEELTGYISSCRNQ
jgi:peroxiredoxin